MNKGGTPANLVASHPGNANAVRYGTHSERVIHTRAAEIEEELFGSSELSLKDRIASSELARLIALRDQIDLDLIERGLLDKKGQPRYIVGMRARVSRELRHWSAELSVLLV